MEHWSDGDRKKPEQQGGTQVVESNHLLIRAFPPTRSSKNVQQGVITLQDIVEFASYECGVR